jgi:hypothetical protein
MHYHCFKVYRKKYASCSACKMNWPEGHDKPLIPVGEDAARDRDDGKRRVRARAEDASDDEDEEMQGEESSQPQRQATQPKRAQRGRKGKARIVEDDEDDDDE